jgi:hypothetical protein
MKTLITASALILASNVAFAASFEEWQQNPDLGTGVYDKPVTLTEPMGGSSDYTVSLDTFNDGNSDHSSHARDEPIRSTPDAGFASSLDGFNQGNPDHV